MKKFGDAESNIELILFSVSDRVVAIEISALVEIVESVPVSPLPFVPAYVEGLININGKILPQVNLATLIFAEEKTGDLMGSYANTLLIVTVQGVELALKIGLVKESVSMRVEQIQDIATDYANEQAGGQLQQYIIGSFEHAGKLVEIFDVDTLRDVVRASPQAAGKQGFLGKVTQFKTHKENYNDYLIADVAGEKYAFELDTITEIVILAEVKEMPRAPDIIEGISLVRGEPRLIVNLAKILGQQSTKKTAQIAVIMVRFQDVLCGILVDRMVGLETVKQGAASSGNHQHQTILREDGHSLTRVMHLQELFTDQVIAQLKPYMPRIKSDSEMVVVNQIEMLKFILEGNAYAFFLNQIRRVVSGKTIEPLLTDQAYIIGTMELEGKVIPVINLVQQLGHAAEKETLTEYIVVSDGHREWGLAISETDQIIQIDEDRIDAVNDKHSRFVSGYSIVNNSLLTILNIQAICHENHHAGAA